MISNYYENKKVEKMILTTGVFLSIFASVSYFMCYVYLPLVSLISFLFLFTFYYGLIKYQRIEYYLFALIVYRPFVKLMFPFDGGMTIALFLIVYFPLLLLAFFNSKLNFDLHKHYPFLLLYLIFSFVSGALFNTFSLYIFQNRYFSLLVFLYIGFVYKKDFDFRLMLTQLRIVFIASLIVYALPNYVHQTQWLLGSVGILGESMSLADSVSFIPRNNGFFFDCRAVGIFSAIFLTVALLYRNYPQRKFDIILSLIFLFTTTSRGAWVLTVFVLIGYLLEMEKNKFRILLYSLCGLMLIAILNDFVSVGNFWETINPYNETGAISQRMFFIEYGFSKFLESPIWGIGAGALKGSVTYDWGELFVGGENLHRQTYITDSFLTSTLAEIGVVGFILFFMYQKEIYFNKSVFSVILMIGLFVQMYGTDVPDYGIQYVFILYVLRSIINYPKSITYRHF